MEKLLKILEELHPDVDFEKEEHLVEDMILDSFDLVSLISEIKEVFDIDIAAKDMIPENFNSAKDLYVFIQRLENEKGMRNWYAFYIIRIFRIYRNIITAVLCPSIQVSMATFIGGKLPILFFSRAKVFILYSGDNDYRLFCCVQDGTM